MVLKLQFILNLSLLIENLLKIKITFYLFCLFMFILFRLNIFNILQYVLNSQKFNLILISFVIYIIINSLNIVKYLLFLKLNFFLKFLLFFLIFYFLNYFRLVEVVI